MKRHTAKEKELEDNARLLHSWRRWHAEQLVEALAGMHRDVLGRLMEQLKDLRSARELVDFISAQNWEAIPADTRLIALHEINQAIMKLRERSRLTPIEDPCQVNRTMRSASSKQCSTSFPRQGGQPEHPAKQWSDENVKRCSNDEHEGRP